jgi:ribosomal protein S18 acetylase RimI-like enzyme
VIEEARPEDAAAIAALFTASLRTAMPWLPVLHDAAEDRWFIEHRVLGECEVIAAREGGELVGFLALRGDDVDHLYVHPAAQRRGHGAALLEAAKARRPGGLELWAFQRNTPALAFYARHGFTERYRTDGADNEEREPDVRLAWRPA